MSASTKVHRTGTPNRSRLLFAVVALLGGLVWSEEKPASSKNRNWASKTAIRPAIPAVKNRSWARQPIDDFILARLEAEKIEPSPEADRATLIRRLSFDLIGLPPTPEEVQ